MTVIDRTTSICSICQQPVGATVFEEDGRVYQRTDCGAHGMHDSMVFSDASLYRSLDVWNDLLYPRPGAVADPPAPYSDDARECRQLSENAPALAVIDITNRCNFKCPLCFAEINGHGGHYFLEPEQIRGMLGSLLCKGPAHCRSIQFSGGEPTLHPKFVEIVRMASSMGFTHIQVATNGSRFTDADYAARCEEAGLHTLYLQFDGVDDGVYTTLRGRPLFEEKIRVVENIARTNMRAVLVPTVVSTVNVDQIGSIFNFALRYSKHVTGISIQPAAQAGRVDISGKDVGFFDLAQMAKEFGRQTNLTRYPEDWFPLSAVALISRAVSRARGEAVPEPACDAHCSLGTYFYVDDDNRAHCLNRFMDLQRFFRTVGRIDSSEAQSGLRRRISQLRQFHLLSQCFDREKAPKGLTFERFLRGLDGWEDKSSGRAKDWSSRGFNGMFVAGMHFMDHRNYDLRRLRRCIIQYVTGSNQLIPFCSYNAGARFRDQEESIRRARAVPT